MDACDDIQAGCGAVLEQNIHHSLGNNAVVVFS
jgi:hypothetical protein